MFINRFANAVVLMTVTLLTGCASGPEFVKAETATQSDKTIVYVYRPVTFTGGVLVPDMYIDGVKLFQMPNKGYAELQLAEGKHALTSDKPVPGTFEFNVTPGQVQYIRWAPIEAGGTTMMVGGIMYSNYDFAGFARIVPEEEALAEIATCKRVYP